MSEGVNAHEYFDVVPHWTGVGGNLNLLPAFEEEVIEDTDEYRIFRASDGVVQKDWKKKSCIPHYIDYALKTVDDWPEYKKRLSHRPKDIEAMYAALKIQVCPLYSHRPMMGWVRNWMGVVENIPTYPDCYGDTVMTLADLTCWVIDQVILKMKTKPGFGFG